MASDVDALPLDAIPATDFGTFVVEVLARKSSGSETIDQKVLRQCIDLASSYLITDTTTNPRRGISTWYIGLSRLIDLVVVLHNRDELELETMNAASRACSECWTASGNWRGLDDGRNRLREIVGKLKKILDTNERTYRGERVYAP